MRWPLGLLVVGDGWLVGWLVSPDPSMLVVVVLAADSIHLVG